MFLSYQDFPIEQREKDSYVNGTAMAKANNVRINEWLRNAKTKSYMQALAIETQKLVADLIEIRRGGDSTNQGTWLHPLLALHFGRWISDPFAIWCDRHIKILIETGETKIGDVAMSLPVETPSHQCDISKTIETRLPLEAIAVLYEIWTHMDAIQDFCCLPLTDCDRSQIVLQKIKGKTSCAEFARQLQTDYQQMRRCLNGQMMTVAIAFRLSRLIGCTMDDIAQLVFPGNWQRNPSPFK